MVIETVLIVSMNHRIVDRRIEHVQLVCGNAIMVDVSVPINDATVSMTAGTHYRHPDRDVTIHASMYFLEMEAMKTSGTIAVRHSLE
jgi:Na+/H+ antiporter NhaC